MAIINPVMEIVSCQGRTVIALRVEFDNFDEANAFTIDLVELWLKHFRSAKRPYEYESPWL